MKVLVIGSGAREHCLAWKISQSRGVSKVYCAPGNGGTIEIAQNVDIAATDIEGLLEFALREKIDITMVGPEAPLVEGIVDRFKENGLKVFGPTKELALLEGSKVFAKEVMKKYDIPTADFVVFSDVQAAKEYVKRKGTPLVVKADGLAAGKGVIVCASEEEALKAIDEILVDKKFGQAGERIVIEECLEGEEASILIFTDGKNIVPLVSSQDHKRAYDDDKGPNTGGMGAYAPAPIVTDKVFKKIMDEICSPLISGLRADGKIYSGILYVGLMIKDGRPSVLEFNVRFGDPETQAILPKLKSDLAEVIIETLSGDLDKVTLQWDERPCVCVVLASGGYPGAYEKGKKIKGLESLKNIKDVFVFHAGTKLNDTLATSGGRVLSIVGLGDDIKEAQGKAYDAIEKVDFEGMHYRKDIASKALKFAD